MLTLAENTKNTKSALSSFSPSLLVQRKCSCGGVSKIGRKCSQCENDKLINENGFLGQTKLKIGQSNDIYEQEADRVAEKVMRSSLPTDISTNPISISRLSVNNSSVSGSSPASVEKVLSGSGRPLDQSVRHDMEQRFGHDFSQVRIYTDSSAARSAHDIRARAYTAGNNIVFNQGEYAPSNRLGKSLLAHELTHTIQQRKCSEDNVQREGFFESINRFFGGGTFSEDELISYLEFLRTNQVIEDEYDSDNKARIIVNQWVKGTSSFVLSQDIKALLIKEMLNGFTGDDDERAILEVLERSYNSELSYFFTEGGINISDLRTNFHFLENNCLGDFITRRFEGGESALESGTVTPIGVAVPFGDELNTNCRKRLPLHGLGAEWNMPCVLSILCSLDTDVINVLRSVQVKSVRSIDVDVWVYQNRNWVIDKVMHPRGSHNRDSNQITISSRKTCEEAVSTLVHEARHETQEDGSAYAKELDAYTYTAQWGIDRGFPTPFSTRNSQTNELEVDNSKIDDHIGNRYAGTNSNNTETIISHDQNGQTVLRLANGSIRRRAAEEGDNHFGDPRFIGSIDIKPEEWAC